MEADNLTKYAKWYTCWTFWSKRKNVYTNGVVIKEKKMLWWPIFTLPVSKDSIDAYFSRKEFFLNRSHISSINIEYLMLRAFYLDKFSFTLFCIITYDVSRLLQKSLMKLIYMYIYEYSLSILGRRTYSCIDLVAFSWV